MAKKTKNSAKITEKLRLIKQREEYESKKAKRTFFIFLDLVILVAFSLSIYFTLIMDYTKTILFLVIGTLLLSFFIIRGIMRKK